MPHLETLLYNDPQLLKDIVCRLDLSELLPHLPSVDAAALKPCGKMQMVAFLFLLQAIEARSMPGVLFALIEMHSIPGAGQLESPWSKFDQLCLVVARHFANDFVDAFDRINEILLAYHLGERPVLFTRADERILYDLIMLCLVFAHGVLLVPSLTMMPWSCLCLLTTRSSGERRSCVTLPSGVCVLIRGVMKAACAESWSTSMPHDCSIKRKMISIQ